MRKRAQPTTSRRPGTAPSRPGSSSSTRSLSSEDSSGSTSLTGPAKRHTSALASSMQFSGNAPAMLLQPPSPSGLTMDDIDFLPSSDEIEALCDPSVYTTEVQLSEEVLKKESDKKNKQELVQRYAAHPTYRNDPSE